MLCENFAASQKTGMHELNNSESVKKARAEYPESVIVVFQPRSELDPRMEKYKYIVAPNVTFMYLLSLVRRQRQIEPSHALFFFIENRMVNMACTVRELQRVHASEILCVTYCAENTFGAFHVTIR